jgi:hypothetical protein
MGKKALHWSHGYFTKFKKDDKDMVKCNFCGNETGAHATRQGDHLLVILFEIIFNLV